MWCRCRCRCLRRGLVRYRCLPAIFKKQAIVENCVKQWDAVKQGGGIFADIFVDVDTVYRA